MSDLIPHRSVDRVQERTAPAADHPGAPRPRPALPLELAIKKDRAPRCRADTSAAPRRFRPARAHQHTHPKHPSNCLRGRRRRVQIRHAFLARRGQLCMGKKKDLPWRCRPGRGEIRLSGPFLLRAQGPSRVSNLMPHRSSVRRASWTAPAHPRSRGTPPGTGRCTRPRDLPWVLLPCTFHILGGDQRGAGAAARPACSVTPPRPRSVPSKFPAPPWAVPHPGRPDPGDERRRPCSDH